MVNSMWQVRLQCVLAVLLTVDMTFPFNMFPALGGNRRLSANHFNMTVPCVNHTFNLYFINYTVDAVEPCGEVPVGQHPLEVKLGNGVDLKLPNATGIENAVNDFESKATLIMEAVVVGLLGLYVLYHICSSSKRAAIKERLMQLWDCQAVPDNPHLSREEHEAEEARRMDVDAEDFIAPGNMFRVLTVLRPDKIGWMPWLGRVLETGGGLLAQFYVPLKIYTDAHAQWEYYGIKSPLWLLEHSKTFILRVTSMGLLCKLFSVTCQHELTTEAEADVFLMTHREKHPEDEECDDSDDDDESSIGNEHDKSLNRHLDRAFCRFSGFQLMLKCCLLFLAMFMTIATFNGEYDAAVIKLAALYLVFDLDRKMVKADLHLKAAYRLEVKRRVHPVHGFKPRALTVLLGVTSDLMKLVTPLGVAATVLLAWSDAESGVIIGGDPWEPKRPPPAEF
eukprot:TRINITY_DN2844_c0_g6_i1.p1 TRINITY_DN2844_c0_g6~~TRINITY_DN2844_c0_g6_i1.p1  ORF type:complete len:450 (-),score=77.81 TRINITY_DN2844_c0_g6_i1:128-1477(-)